MVKISREYIYKEVDKERAYQDKKWGALDDVNSVGDFLCYMKRFLDHAMQENNPKSPSFALDDIRKITALGVACMEVHGVCPRLD